MSTTRWARANYSSLPHAIVGPRKTRCGTRLPGGMPLIDAEEGSRRCARCVDLLAFDETKAYVPPADALREQRIADSIAAALTAASIDVELDEREIERERELQRQHDEREQLHWNCDDRPCAPATSVIVERAVAGPITLRVCDEHAAAERIAAAALGTTIISETPVKIDETHCEAEIELTGPHEGCAEFAAPDVDHCGRTATTLFVIVDHYAPESGLREPMRLCDEHASELRHDAAVDTSVTIVSETPIDVLVVPAPHDPSDDSTQPAHDVDDTLSAQQRQLLDARRPYVGEGADGARRSAEIDRSEADTLDPGERRDERLASARRWDEQAAALSEQGSGELAGGDVQPLTRRGKHGVRRNRRHDQTSEQIEAKLAERRASATHARGESCPSCGAPFPVLHGPHPTWVDCNGREL